MQLDARAQPALVERTRGSDRREDAAAGGVQFLVARAARPQRELLHPVPAEGRVRVTVHEARDGAQVAPVELLFETPE